MSGGNDSSRAMSAATVGIVVALPEELATLTRSKPALGECFAINNRVFGVYAGAGPLNAAKAANTLIGKGVTYLISWGCAAALSPDLKPGDLLLPMRVLAEHGEAFSTVTQDLQDLQSLLSENLTINTRDLLESSRIVAESREKQRLYSQTGAVGLDMESAAVIKVAASANIPCLVVRAVADPVHMNLPAAVVHALNAQGQIELPKLLGYLLMHPWQIPALIKLGQHFHAAQRTLQLVANKLNHFIDFKQI